MPRYDHHDYDFGLRGRRETMERRPYGERDFGAGPRARAAYDRDYDGFNVPPTVYPNRVTARYNDDYVYGGRGAGRRAPENYHPYGGDREERIGDASYYHAPYTTIGGSRTWRGAPSPYRYDRDLDRDDRRPRYDRGYRREW